MILKIVKFPGLITLAYLLSAIIFRIYRTRNPEKFGYYLPRFYSLEEANVSMVEKLSKEPTFIEYFFMPAEVFLTFIGI
jgi:hypothetical protein